MSAVAWPSTEPGRSKQSLEVGKKKGSQLFSLHQAQIKLCLPQEPPVTSSAPQRWEV